MGIGTDADADAQARDLAFRQAMQRLGWVEGRNIRYEYRTRSTGASDIVHRNAAEIVALAPDVIWVVGTRNIEALQQATRTIPIVFAGVTDPVGAGFVESLSRPGGNITGFT